MALGVASHVFLAVSVPQELSGTLTVVFKLVSVYPGGKKARLDKVTKMFIYLLYGAISFVTF